MGMFAPPLFAGECVIDFEFLLFPCEFFVKVGGSLAVFQSQQTAPPQPGIEKTNLGVGDLFPCFIFG